MLYRAEDWQLPTLLIHGRGDDEIPASISIEFDEDAPSSRLELFAAGHIRSYNADPERYRDVVTNFLDGLVTDD